MYDLLTVYIMLHVRRKPTIEEQKDILHKLYEILNDGYTFKTVLDVLFGVFLQNKQFTNPNQIASYLSNAPKDNLIKQEIYYHKELRIQPSPSVTEVDYNTGTMVSSGQEFFVEMAASYTLDELLQYLLSFGYVNTIEFTPNRIKGLLKHYLKKYGIDIVLFIMEAISNNIEDKQTFNFDRFESYYSIANGYINNIKNNCHSTGGDKIIPRKRRLFQ